MICHLIDELGEDDPFFGCGTTRSIDPYKETDFSEPNFNLPYINSIIEKLGRTLQAVADKKAQQ